MLAIRLEGFATGIRYTNENRDGTRVHDKSPSNEYATAMFPRNLLRVIVTLVIVVDVLLQVVVGVGLLKVLAEGSVSRVSTSWCYTIRRLVILCQRGSS